MNKPHRIPLPTIVQSLVLGLQGLSEDLVFPGIERGRPLSDMNLTAVLRRLKFDAIVHGFRSSFRDWSEETTDYRHEVNEAALAHQVSSAVERAYRRTDLFDLRRELMGDWANFCIGDAGIDS